MSLYPQVFVLTLLALAVAMVRPRYGFAAAGALLPLGMGAALVLTAVGNLTVLASTAAFAGLTVMTLIRPALGTGAPVMPRVEARTMLMLLIAVWGVVSAFIMPRLFAQEIDVISYARSASGMRVSHQFSTTLTPLVPSSGNLSQPAYLLLSALLSHHEIFRISCVIGGRHAPPAGSDDDWCPDAEPPRLPAARSPCAAHRRLLQNRVSGHMLALHVIESERQ